MISVIFRLFLMSLFSFAIQSFASPQECLENYVRARQACGADDPASRPSILPLIQQAQSPRSSFDDRIIAAERARASVAGYFYGCQNDLGLCAGSCKSISQSMLAQSPDLARAHRSCLDPKSALHRNLNDYAASMTSVEQLVQGLGNQRAAVSEGTMHAGDQMTKSYGKLPGGGEAGVITSYRRGRSGDIERQQYMGGMWTFNTPFGRKRAGEK